MKMVLDTDPMHFVEMDELTGLETGEELKPGGRDVVVTEENKLEYVGEGRGGGGGELAHRLPRPTAPTTTSTMSPPSSPLPSLVPSSQSLQPQPPFLRP